MERKIKTGVKSTPRKPTRMEMTIKQKEEWKTYSFMKKIKLGMNNPIAWYVTGAVVLVVFVKSIVYPEVKEHRERKAEAFANTLWEKHKESLAKQVK